LSRPGPKRVIILDDDEAVRDSLAILLETHGYEVTSFASARAFLDSGETGEGGCLILDLHLPDMSGFDVLRKLEGRMKVIMITARSDAATRQNALDAGAMTLLEKPFTDELLVSTIQRAD
jgi:two-component system, LuxR family, response regulator FixJ